MTQYIFVVEADPKPFMITYINSSTFLLFLVGVNIFKSNIHWLAFKFSIIWTLANYTAILSLSLTSVSISTIASSSCGIFTFVIGLLLRTESYSHIKLISCLGSVFGVYLLCGDSFMVNIGLFVGLASAFFYGVYSQVLKVSIDDTFNMREFIGCVGLWNTLLLWPIFFLLHFTNLERFEFPRHQFHLILVNALIGTALSEYFWIKAISTAAPIVVTLGLGITIPLTMLIDVFILHHHLTTNIIIGGSIVVLSFIAVEYSPKQIQEDIEDEIDICS